MKPDPFLIVIKTVICVMLATMIGLIGLAINHRIKENRYDKTDGYIYTYELGKVTRISECDSGKSSYRCWVYLQDGKPFRTDITDWPNRVLAVGESIHIQKITQGERQRTLWCNMNVGKCYDGGANYRGDDYFREFYVENGQPYSARER